MWLRSYSHKIFAMLAVALLWATPVFAVELPNPLKNILPTASAGGVVGLIGLLLQFLLGLVGIGALVVFIAGGIILLTSAGASDKIEKGKGVIANGVLGLIFVFSAYLIVKFVVTLIEAQGA